MQKIKRKFIGGFGERAAQYRWLGRDALNLDWNRPSLRFKADVLAAFSMGTVVILNDVNRIKPKLLILCSMPPFLFDINALKVKKIVFMCGEKEKDIVLYYRKMYRKFRGEKEFVIVKGASHKISGPYRKAFSKYFFGDLKGN